VEQLPIDYISLVRTCTRYLKRVMKELNKKLGLSYQVHPASEKVIEERERLKREVGTGAEAIEQRKSLPKPQKRKRR
jgi:hypothetical protein